MQIMAKLNETAVVGIFDSKEIAIQHINGTGDSKLQSLERQIFSTQPFNMDCQDLKPSQSWLAPSKLFLNRIYLVCNPVDPATVKKAFIYTFVDGSSVPKPFEYDITIPSGRSRVEVATVYDNELYTPYLLQYDDTLWDAAKSTINFRAFGFDTLRQVANFAGIKSFKIDFMQTVYAIYPRGNRVLIYGIFYKKPDPSSSSSASSKEEKSNQFNSDKNGKQVLIECRLDFNAVAAQAGFKCYKTISFHDTSIYLGFDQNGNHLDIYMNNDKYMARSYKFQKRPYVPVEETSHNSDNVMSYVNFEFDTAAMQDLLKTSKIWNFDVTSSGLRLRFVD
jgi:hypothetical protein